MSDPAPGDPTPEIVTSKAVHTALDVIAEEGYRRLTVSVICHRSGVSQGQYYEQFPTAASFLRAVIALLLERWRDRAEASRAIDLTDDPRRAWLARLERTMAERELPDGRVWLVLASIAFSDPIVANELSQVAPEIGELSRAEFAGLPGVDAVPGEVLLGLGLAANQLGAISTAFEHLVDIETPGVSTLLRFLTDRVCEEYGIGVAVEDEPLLPALSRPEDSGAE